MNALKVTTLALALAGAFPTLAQTTTDTNKEIQALKDRLAEVEKKQKAEARKESGSTEQQAKEIARVAVKTEALEDSRDASGLKGLKISGYIDPTYIYNYDLRRAGFQFVVPIPQVGYGYSASYFGSAYLDFQKETDSGTRWRLTIMPARSTSDVFGDMTIVHEASASIPLGDQKTRLIAGQIPDWSGYEYLPATQNKLITHNLLFDFTLPIAYTGAGVELIRGKWNIKALIANLNASHRKDGEYIPVVAYRVDYSGGEYWGLGLAGANGFATNWAGDFPDSMVNLLEVDAYYARGDITLQGQIGAGMQRSASVTPDPVTGALRTAEWIGVSGLFGYKFTPRFEGILRADFIYNERNGGGLLTYSAADDHNGIGPDPAGNPEIGTNRWAATVGVNYAFNANTTFKLEYRYDGASLPVFLEDPKAPVAGYAKSNHLLGTSVVVFF